MPHRDATPEPTPPPLAALDLPGHGSPPQARGLPSPPALLAVVVCLEFVTLLCVASRRPFWYDEIFTAALSGLHPLSRISQALDHGADGLPLWYYLIVQWARLVPAPAEIAIRLPSIAGHLASLAGIYCFVSNRLTRSLAVSAVLLFALSPFAYYSVEARPYALLVGSLSAAAAFWQRIDQRKWALPLFVICLATAVSVHYLAVFVLPVFALAELSLAATERGIRMRALAGIVLAGAPFLLSFPTLLRFRALYATGYWSKPVPTSFYAAYDILLGLGSVLGWVLVVLFLLTAWHAVRQRKRPAAGPKPLAGFQTAELVLTGGLLLLPPSLVALTMALHSGYTPRYSCPVMLGFVFGSAFLLERWVPPDGRKALLIALLLGFAGQTAARMARFWLTPPIATAVMDRWGGLRTLTQAVPEAPIVIADPQEFFEMEYYLADPALRPRLRNVVDPQTALAQVGYDTMDRANPILGSLVGFPAVMPLAEFRASLAAQHGAYLYASHDARTWLQRYLAEAGYQLRLLADNPHAALYLVTR